MKFSHDETGFKLTGQHSQVDCNSCHTNLDFSLAQTNCLSCHKDIHQNTVGGDCQNCHTTETWIVKNILQIHQLSRFPLVGMHQSIDCARCHPGYNNLNFQPIGATCFSCHRNDYNSAKAPDHLASHYSTDCETCHKVSNAAWTTTNFQHDFFPLTGGHNLNNCFSCHKTNTFAGLSVSCVSCHLTNFNNTTNPNHVVLKLSTDCQLCHAITSFSQTTFNHSSTGFTLTGAHNSLQCTSCHISGTSGLGTTCISCHQANYNSAANHLAQNYPTDCTMCHSTTNWTQSTFNHQTSAFPLTGAHTSVSCASCHTSGFGAIPTTCISCHQAAYNTATNPNHSAAGLSTDCSTCHNSIAWIPSTFDHSTSGFALTGNHLTIQCSACHVGKVTGLSPLCYSCHQANFTSASNHVSQNYPTTCEMCHNTSDWTQSTFNHQTTPFPLTGAHTTVLCSNCHTSGFGTIPTTCVSCHQSNYNGTTNPNHSTLKLSTSCETCHSTNPGWTPATFSIHNTYFVLTGFHTSLTCEQCHNGTYNGTSPGSTCISCHQTDFNNTTNPNHAAAQFPVDCTNCHSQSAWTPSTFNHDAQYFPIYSGSHNNRWTLCSQCHQDPTNFATFTCMSSGCHPQSQTDSEHKGKSGYSYTASACYSCHPRGSSDLSIHGKMKHSIIVK